MCYIVFVHRYKQHFNQAIHFENLLTKAATEKKWKNKEYPM